MRRGSADFDVRAVRFVVPCQWILGLAATATAPAILLSLPHRLLFNPDKRLMPRLLPCPQWCCVLGSSESKFSIHSLRPRRLKEPRPNSALRYPRRQPINVLIAQPA